MPMVFALLLALALPRPSTPRPQPRPSPSPSTARWLAPGVEDAALASGTEVGGVAAVAGEDDEAAAAVVVPRAIDTAPRIDGVLDDNAWTGDAVPMGEWRSYNPLYGDTVPQQTRVWVAYDADALYFAFQCDDPEPAAIKTSISRRDNFGGDDWVGLSLDALGTGQLSYHMMVNPSGIQLDMLNSAGGDEDSSVDWVWESAGRTTAGGYTVEIRLPLRSIRFASGNNVKMGLLFWRRVSRLGMSVAWPPLEPGRWVFDKHATMTVAHLDARLPRDIIPSVTLSERQVRETPAAWGPLSTVRDAGLSAKVGLSSTAILDATINPDFSQVESDSYQVEVNQRFPVFYSEKRPFFMEGAGIFTIAGAGSDNSLQTAVHTRRIINPLAGVKFTGGSGRTTYATLSALDESPGDGAAANPAGGHRLFNVGRAQYSLGPGTYVGGLAVDVERGRTANRVGGVDARLRLSPTQRVTTFAFASRTTASGVNAGEAASARSGVAANVGYQYSTRAMSVSGAAEHYDRGFQMDTAFINRVGISSAWAYVDRNLYPTGRWTWLRRVTPFSFLQGGRDRVAGGRDLISVSGARFNFTRQGFLRVDRSWGYEPWAGERFARGRWRSWGNVQLTRWINLNGRYETGRAVYYDAVAPFGGESQRTNAGFTVQPSGRIAQTLSWDHVGFARADTGVRVFTVDVVNSKTIYQFTRRLYARGLLQYDSARRRVLTDLLMSWEMNPGTIAYVGYGGLLERVERDSPAGPDGRIDDAGPDPFRATARGLLFKVSYLKRF